LRATRLAALSAEAGTLDAPCEAIHGISAAGDTALPPLRAWRATRPGRRDLGELLFALREYRVLDERRICRPERIGCGETDFRLYVLYRGKSEKPIVFPELLTKSIILDKLETISHTVASQ